jgi:hypothetical protein
LVEDWTAIAGHGGRLEEAGGAGRHCRSLVDVVPSEFGCSVFFSLFFKSSSLRYSARSLRGLILC